jgi:hypothetical protein
MSQGAQEAPAGESARTLELVRGAVTEYPTAAGALLSDGGGHPGAH